MKISLLHLPWWLALLVSLNALTACATSKGIVDHSFTFDAISDSPDVTVLDFRYGTSKQPGASNDDELRAQGRSVQRTNTSGPMIRGDHLFVKWRIKATGEILEDTVDLRQRLPRSIEDQRLYFIIKGRQLHVYLISSERRSPGAQPIGSSTYDHLKAITVYPDQRKP